MMNAMMAAGRMRRTLGEGQQHGPRGTVPSAAAAPRHQQTSPRRVAGSKISFFCRLKPVWCNLGSEIALWKALAF